MQIRYFFLSLLAAMLLLGGCASTNKSVPQQKNEVRGAANATLAKLYSRNPSAKAAVESAAGYGTFSNFGLKILVAGGGKGSGLVVNNASGHETFMRMVEVQAGLGFGVKEFRLVFVFETQEALNQFVNSGWQFGGQATAAAKLGDKGAAFAGAVSVAPGIWVYQMTGDGLALEVTLKGTKFYQDDQLN